MDRRLATVLLLAAAAGVARASAHFIRLALVAVMGLAGMYMLHVLAQDYNAIRQPVRAKVASAILRSVIAKRSAADSPVVGEAASAGRPSLDWGRVLRADPAGCARRVLCELAAKPELRLSDADRRLLALVTDGGGGGRGDVSWRAFWRAVEVGRSAADPAACWAAFRGCPHSTALILGAVRAAASTADL
ncbi:uncharacterized protein LOC124607407 [Schistocerca americana]|uniref:uncharacterized protein LOC124607407 n=1 Tax=Schistocerca americana TaxID=7009 RepID=UPI001F4F99B1|nr:uncharacterized protein LOC124607407 [Schistocerca americana]